VWVRVPPGSAVDFSSYRQEEQRATKVGGPVATLTVDKVVAKVVWRSDTRLGRDREEATQKRRAMVLLRPHYDPCLRPVFPCAPSPRRSAHGGQNARDNRLFDIDDNRWYNT